MARNEIMSAIGAAQLEEKRRRNQGTGGGSGNNGGSGMRALFSVFPLLVIPVAIYAIMAFTTGGIDADTLAVGETAVAPLADRLNSGALTLNMISGVEWKLTNGDLLILFALALLFLEILKSTSTGTATIMNHAISMILFIACLILFLLSQNFATSTFFILTVMTLLDVLAGVVVTIVSARRDFAVGEGFSG
ncbi:MAG: hypothetical protein AAFQ22_09075 [Pseudomonadota bacterium]